MNLSKSSAPRLTEPQRKVLLAAAADPDYHTTPIGLADGPRRTARKLADLGLGRYLFYGTGMFQANRAGRELAAKLLRDAHRPREATQRDIVWVESLTPHDIGARGRAEVLGGGGDRLEVRMLDGPHVGLELSVPRDGVSWPDDGGGPFGF